VTTPRITTVVVVHGSTSDTVDACIESVLGSRDVDLHIVLVDNASPDAGAACARWVTDDRVTVVHSAANGGFAAGVNQGLRQRRAGDAVLLLNDDATVAPDALSICAQQLVADPASIAVVPRVMLAGQRELIDSIGVVLRPNGEAFNAFIGQTWSGQVATGQRVFGPCFAATLIRADAFDAGSVGLLDERYRLYYEDIDWGLRAQRLGQHTVAAPDAVVWHRHAGSTRLLGEPARYELVQRNLLLCATKNFTARAAMLVWVTRLVVHGKGVVTGPYRLPRLRSMGRALVGLPAAVAARRSLPRRRTVSDAELFRYSHGMTPNFDAETLRVPD
jgi:GT2 family glycosyltransferase